MIQFRCVAALVVLLSATALIKVQGQQPSPPPAPPPTGLIMGRVVDGSTERPVGNVVVTLTGPQAVPGAPARAIEPARVVTDSSGRFLFAGLAAGQYAFSVSGSAAWFGGGYGMRRPGGAVQPFELADGQRVTDITLRAWKYASVSGTVTDQFGEPVIEAKVGVIRLDIVAGRRRYGQRFEALTDDRGMYRISRLVPGDYVACLPFTEVTFPAKPDPDASTGAIRRQLYNSGAGDPFGAGFRIDDFVLVRVSTAYSSTGPLGPMFTTPAPVGGRVLVYPFQFFPSAMRPADATVLTLASGEDRSATDFQTRLVPSVRISGRVSGPGGTGAHLAVRLLPQAIADTADERAMEIAVTTTDRDGAFTMLGVPAGTYVVKVALVPTAPRPAATPVTIMGPTGGVTSFASPNTAAPPPPVPDAPTVWATVPVNVADADISNLDVVMQSGPRVTGRIAYDGAREPLTADELVRLTATIDPIDGRTGPSVSSYGQFDASGQFKSAGIVPGRYIVRIGGNLAGWAVKSVLAGGRDVSDEPLTIQSADLPGLIVTLTDRPSAISGTVRDGNGAPNANAVVLLFPADRARWTDQGASPRRQRRLPTSATGSYETTNLPPGEYLVIAVDDRVTMNWQDARRLAQFAQSATRVTIGDGERRTQNLVTATVR